MKTLYFLAKILIIATMLGTSLAMYDSNMSVFKQLNVAPANVRLFYAFVGVATLWVALQRQTYLPFLGECALPPTAIVPKTAPPTEAAGAKVVSVQIKAPGAQKLAWWAAEPQAKGSNAKAAMLRPKEAYNKFGNSGVVDVVNGAATIQLVCPQRYRVRTGVLRKHVHYREVYGNGLLSEVRTVYVDC
jgi:hypothetical protein